MAGGAAAVLMQPQLQNADEKKIVSACHLVENCKTGLCTV
jgi:hypothetical protein